MLIFSAENIQTKRLNRENLSRLDNDNETKKRE